jgi:acetyl esterase/lipase
VPIVRRFAAAFLSLAVLASAGCTRGAWVATRDLSYEPAHGYLGTFDLYEPPGDRARANRPAILAIHGGAWRGGDKPWADQFARELCPFGYVVFSVNYRLSSRPGGTWPAQIHDVQKALRYIRANARRFRIDPTRIASLGMSAGGHLATMVALRDDSAGSDGRVRVTVNLDGEHDMTMPPEQVMADFDLIMTDVLGHPAPWTGAELRDISTVTYARPDVSVLTVHGAGDDNVFVSQGERLHAVLRSKGAKSEFVRIAGPEGKCHANCWRVPEARRALHRFLDRELAQDGDGFFAARQRRPSSWTQD